MAFCGECGKAGDSAEKFCEECGAKRTAVEGPPVVNTMGGVPPGGVPAPPVQRNPPPPTVIVRPEQTALAELKALFNQMAGLDIHPDSFEFPAFQEWCGSLDIVLKNPKATFDALDVAHSGSVDVNEFLFAISGAYFAEMAHTPGINAAHAVKEALLLMDGHINHHPKRGEKSITARGIPEAAAAEVQEGHGGVTCMSYVCATALPCYICCEDLGQSMDDKKLEGMGAVRPLFLSLSLSRTHTPPPSLPPSLPLSLRPSLPHGVYTLNPKPYTLHPTP
jgi:hypothetical protein